MRKLGGIRSFCASKKKKATGRSLGMRLHLQHIEVSMVNHSVSAQTLVLAIAIVVAATAALFYFRRSQTRIKGRLPQPLSIDYGNHSFTWQAGEST